MAARRTNSRRLLWLYVTTALTTWTQAQSCADVDISGCGGDGPFGAGDEFLIPGFFGASVVCDRVFDAPGGADGCSIDPASFNAGECIAGQKITADNPAVGAGFIAAACNAWLAGCCSEGGSLAPTFSPTTTPSTSPTKFPSQAPSLSPTKHPSNSPSGSPTTSPSPAPTGSPGTPIPTSNTAGFFDDEQNIYIVAGAGGGGLLLAAVAVLLLARRRGRNNGKTTTLSSKGKSKALANKETGGVGGVAPEDIFDWEKHIDKKSGEVYFFNPKTGESRWDPPQVKGSL